MKQIKRLTTLALAVMLLLSLAIPAFAADGVETTYTVTIKNATGHTYKIYQIFTGDLSTNADRKEVLSNIKFGADYLPAKGEGEGTYAVGDEVPESFLANPTSIEPTGAGTEMTPSEDGKTATATGLAAGYYMIKDVTKELPEGDTSSAIIFQVVGDTQVTSKHDSTPKTYKKIDDVNDSTGEGVEIEWHDSADHDIGDLIDFQLNAVIPSSIEVFREYNEDKAADAKMPYRFVFHDVEETGLTFNKITSVYVLNGETKTVLESGYTLVTNPTDGCTFEVVFEDLTTITAVKGGSTLVVEYKSELNENAVIGENGNVNKMRGEYSNFNNPDNPGLTPWDTVIAFTYKLEANKYANEVNEGNELKGAGFTLYKWYANTATADETDGEWKKIGNEVKGEALTTFAWKGIDDGKYKLEETTTPAGYNTIDPIEFTVTANHDVVWETQNREDVLTSLSGEKESGDVREIVFKATDDKSTLSTDVINKSGIVLPETGGMGTTIFYVLGGMMVLVAVVLLVTKKRMASAE